MNIVSISYSKTESFTNPAEWLAHISFYTGILEELAKEHKVFSIENINYHGFYEKNHVKYYFIRNNSSNRFPLRIHQLVKNLDADVVLVNGFIFPLQIMQLKMKLGKYAKILVFHRAEKPFKGPKRLLQYMAARSVDAFLFTTIALAEKWVKKAIIPKSKVKEVVQASSSFHPKNKDAARKKLNVLGSPVYLWVGRLDQNKDPVTVVKGFISFLERQPAARLYMIYQEDKLISQVKREIETSEKAKAAVLLMGKKPRRELEDWYNAADFFISGSHSEGSGIAVIEAMSCGCIPVLTKIPSFIKLLAGKCGFLYEADDVDELAELLEKTISVDLEEEKRKTVAQFEEQLSFKAIAGKLQVIFNEI
jgi:glycosyltransferase involved in cell wall biosynthesis